MLWGGRFRKNLDKAALRFSTSFPIDIRLLPEDIEGSLAHAEMLSKIGLLSQKEFDDIAGGLKKIEKEWNGSAWPKDLDSYEDVHSAIEARLYELIGDAAGKLHTGRSRNDQIATCERLWTKKACLQIKSLQVSLQKTLLSSAERHTETLMPGYTHLQRAQPISLAFHFLAYMEMLERDKNRFVHVIEASDSNPLGSAALAGSTLPLDRELTRQILRFEKSTANAMDTVSDRDYFLDFLHACGVGMMHLSRLAEEMILWSTSEWNFIQLSDEYSTGSSLMPQKKNPDMAELIRGKVGRVYGHYMALSTTMKGLPLSYNRDLQEDKIPVFDSFDTYCDCLEIMTGMIATMRVNDRRFESELAGSFSLATDLADALVMKGVAFREAHRIVGQIVQFAEEKGQKFSDLSLSDLKTIYSGFAESDLELLKIEQALKRKKTTGSPNPDLVKQQIERWRKTLTAK